MVGEVIGTKMLKTIKVRVERVKWNELVQKPVIRHRNYLVHDEQQQCVVGDIVEIENCSKKSKRKNFELSKVVTPAQRYTDPETGISYSQRPDPPRRDRAKDYGAKLFN